ncbi:GNAT family N-acetyltransferase [Nocardioides sp. TF02-7]|uniref:GNAT family N-acetyltransferase n=1 Tax=Nocardioides sp. TF02-7 TaxID=2917724 RepID=UPI001F061123|nr:GNAT family N-acetyltransferase [Nocardioides sp. TF02-7]UMG92745.1 GNAT family N-acetyltransferase [Nocardioides sp. TF02-7]
MSDTRVRVLDEADWPLCRDLRLAALRESPESFVASYEDEKQYDEQAWRERTRQGPWLAAERDGRTVGLVGLALHRDDPELGEIYGLWVRPDARGNRVARDLVQAASERARADERRRLYFWVGSDNGPAVAFASSFGFRPTSERRLVRTDGDGEGVPEIAMVLPLRSDPVSVANPYLP